MTTSLARLDTSNKNLLDLLPCSNCQVYVLPRSNLPPEVKCPGGKLLRSKLSPGHFTSKQTVRPGHSTSKKSDPLRSRLSPLQGDILLRSRVSGGQFTSK